MSLRLWLPGGFVRRTEPLPPKEPGLLKLWLAALEKGEKKEGKSRP